MATIDIKLITVTNPPPAPSTGSDVNKGGALLGPELDQSLINLRKGIQDVADQISLGSTYVNPTLPTFGAVGDGITDDTAAIQAAYNSLSTSGGVVFFPPGIYLLSPTTYLWLTVASNRKNWACILVPNNVISQGFGAVFKLASTPANSECTDGLGLWDTTHMFANVGAVGLPKTPVNHDIYFKGMSFDGNNIPMSGEAVSFCGVKNFGFTDNKVYNTYFESNYFVYCRGGIVAGNNYRHNGQFQVDGSGPFIDTCTDVEVIDNIISDCGYYAILSIDCWDCNISRNQVRRDTYATSTGYEGIRLVRSNNNSVTDNKLSESGFSGIKLHDSQNNIVSGNRVFHSGFGTGAGSSSHGIVQTGISARNKIVNNYSINNKGAGIAIVEQGDSETAFAIAGGSLVQGNTCLFNMRDGIAVYGNNHRIMSNLCESNGLEITTGVLGDGYSGISLNGVKYATISGNTCTDTLQSTVLNMNIDAVLGASAYLTASTVDHRTVQTQNFGIVEYPVGSTNCDYNIITENNLINNLVNSWSTPISGGFYRRPYQGTNDIISNNIAD